MKRVIIAAAILSIVGGTAASAQPYRDRDRDGVPNRYDRRDNRYSYGGRYYDRYRGSPYAYPRGYTYRSWARGQYLPRAYFASPYYIDNWAAYRLRPPPRGYRYVRVGNDIVLAACPGELFVQLQLDWKKKMELAGVKPFLFGYTWSGGSWPGYVADVRSAALGGYGADQGDRLIEVGAGETMITHQLANFYRLSGLMRDKPGPTGFKPGAQWIIKPFQP